MLLLLFHLSFSFHTFFCFIFLQIISINIWNRFFPQVSVEAKTLLYIRALHIFTFESCPMQPQFSVVDLWAAQEGLPKWKSGSLLKGLSAVLTEVVLLIHF